MMHRLTALPARGLLAAGALLTLFAGASLARGKAQDTYQWTFDYKKGEIEKFRTYITITGKKADGSGGLSIELKSHSKHDYKEVTPEGEATYEESDEMRETVVDNKEIGDKPDERRPITITLNKNGLVLKRVNPTADPTAYKPEKVLMAIKSMPVPDKPVKVGDTWKTDIPNPVLKGKMIPVTSTLEAVEKMLGQDALKVKLQMDIPIVPDATDKEIVKVQETYYLDAKTHRLLRSAYIIKNAFLPFPGNGYEVRTLVSRIVPGQNDKDDAAAAKELGAGR